jgi:hypothetical protein
MTTDPTFCSGALKVDLDGEKQDGQAVAEEC